MTDQSQANAEPYTRTTMAPPVGDGGLLTLDWLNGQLIQVRKATDDCVINATGFWRTAAHDAFVNIDFGVNCSVYMDPSKARQLAADLLYAATVAEASS